MTCEHSNPCKSPVCTVSSGPKRPKIGIAREREDILANIEAIITSCGVWSRGKRDIRFWNIHNATEFIRLTTAYMGRWSMWRCRMVLVSCEPDQVVTYSLKRLKE